MEHLGKPPDEQEMRMLCSKAIALYYDLESKFKSFPGLTNVAPTLIQGYDHTKGYLDVVGFQFLVPSEDIQHAKKVADLLSEYNPHIRVYVYPSQNCGKFSFAFYPRVVTAHEKLAYMAQMQDQK